MGENEQKKTQQEDKIYDRYISCLCAFFVSFLSLHWFPLQTHTHSI